MLDIANSLESILTITDAHFITNVFLFFIIGVFIVSLVLVMLNKGRGFTAYTPTLLTSLGILGTFVGIVIGLLEFDPKNIDGSITLLLSGLKTAFITSLIGMTFTIIYKLLNVTAFFKKNDIAIENTEVEAKDILEAITHQDSYLSTLVEMMQKQDQHFSNLLDVTNKQKQYFIGLLEASNKQDKYFVTLIKNQNHHFGELKKVIAGEEKSSLTGQLKLLRSDVNNNHKIQQNNFSVFSNELSLSLKNFSDILSKSATDKVIKALKEVITNFNKNLTEQFGDNFKALDKSVEKLVVWQAEYGKQLNHMIDQYSEGVKAISDIELSVNNINKETKNIPHTMADLKTIMEVNQHQITELSRHLHVFKELKDQAVKAIPEMQIHVEKTVDDISLASKKANEGYQLLLLNTESVQKTFITSIENIKKQIYVSIEALIEKQIEEMSKSFSALEKGSYSIQENTKSMQKSLMLTIDNVQENLKNAMESLIKKQIEEMNKSFNAVENEVAKSVDMTGKAVNKQLEMIDSSMTQEVNRVMTEMGGALGSISGQFTEDYKKLTDAMHKVVSDGERVY